jgi:hypothetical protein
MKGTKARGQSEYYNLVYAPKKVVFETAKSEFKAMCQESLKGARR